MPLEMAGFGGGSTSTSTKGKVGGTKSKKKGKKKKNDQASFDASAALLRSEKLYDQMSTEDAKKRSLYEESDTISNNDETTFSEFVVAARYSPKQSQSSNPQQRIAGSSSVCDWTPVAQICLLRSRHNTNEDNRLPPQLTEAISVNCREIHHAAIVSAPIFAALPRSDIEYSVETVDSFHKFVHDFVLEDSSSSSSNTNKDKDAIENMTLKEARIILKLEEGCSDLSIIKKSYRTLSFQYHPDRFIIRDTTADKADDLNNDNDAKKQMEEKKGEAQELFIKVKYAYELLIRSGVTATTTTASDSNNSNNSWYAALGGRERTDFKGPLELIQLKKAQTSMDRCINGAEGYKSAICGLDPELVNNFTVRNQSNAALTR